MSRRWCISKIQFKWLFSEIDDVETGLLIEVWDKGMLWDKAIGYFWTPLQSLQFSAVVRTIYKKCHHLKTQQHQEYFFELLPSFYHHHHFFFYSIIYLEVTQPLFFVKTFLSKVCITGLSINKKSESYSSDFM